MHWIVYLSGEIHSDWRDEIKRDARSADLPVHFVGPVLDHAASDDCGDRAFGAEADPFWKDHKAAKLNAIRTRTWLDKADVVVVRFGDQYRQWNAAFEAGYAVARGKALVTLHGPEHRHALKEVDASALAVAETPAQVVAALEYALTA